MKMREEMDSCGLCVKYLMFTMNIVFFIIGAAIVGVGLWVLLDENYLSPLFGTPLLTAAGYAIVVSGCLIIVISFFGCCGAINLNKCMLMTYFIVMLLIFLTMITGGILALIFRTQIGEQVRIVMEESIVKYYGVEQENPYNRMITESWDKAQERLRCCSAADRGFRTYEGSAWYTQQEGLPGTDRPLVPESCCVRDQYGELIHKQRCQNNPNGPPTLTAGDNHALHMQGCYYAGRRYIMEFSAAFIGIGIGVGILMILGMVFSLILYRYIED